MAAAILERAGTRLVHNRAGANMAGGVASTLLQAARRGGAIDGQLGLFEVDEFWLDRVVPELRPRAVLLGNLFRDQLDRYGELETIADRWAATVAACPTGATLALNADDPLIADLGRQHAGVALLRRRGSGDGHRRDAARLGLQALPPLRRAVRLRRDLPRPPRRLPLPHLRPATRPQPAVAAQDIALHGTRGAAFTLRTPAGDGAGRAPAARPLQRLQRARRGDAVPGARRLAGDDRRRPGGGRPAFGRAERVAIGDRELSILLIKNPAAPTRSCARSRSSPAGSTCWPCSTTAPPTAATSPGCGTPTSRCSPAASRQVTCAGHPRRRAGAAAEVRRACPTERLDAWSRRSAPALDAALRGRPRPRCSRCPPTRRCWSCARSSSAAATSRRSGMTRPRTATGRSGTTSSAAATRQDLALWRELAAAPAARCSTSAPGTGRMALELAREGHEVIALDLDAELLAALRGAPRGLPVRPWSADARAFGLGTTLPLIIVPMQTVQLLGGTARPRRLSANARPLTCDPAGCWPSRSPTTLELFDARRHGDRRCPTSRARRRRLPSRPIAVRADADGFVLERRRETVAPDGQPHRRARRDPARPARPPTARGRGRGGRPAARRPRGDRARPTTTSAARW